MELATGIARSAFSDERFLPHDVTEFRVSEPITVMGAQTASSEKQAVKATRTEPRVVLTIIPAFRCAAGFRVYGRGSHTVVSMANNQAIVGVLRCWRTASLGERVRVNIIEEQVRASIERQLRAVVATEGTQATADKIDIAYYDANANYLQPVYYFEATVKSGSERVSNIKIAGYVPIAKELEPIPDLSARPEGPTPATPKQNLKAGGCSPHTSAWNNERCARGSESGKGARSTAASLLWVEGSPREAKHNPAASWSMSLQGLHERRTRNPSAA